MRGMGPIPLSCKPMTTTNTLSSGTGQGGTAAWQPFIPGNGRGVLDQNLAGQHTIEVRVKAGKNIGLNAKHEMHLTLEKSGSDYPHKDKHEIYSPAMRLIAFGGKGCQTRAQNPSCTGFWDWPGFDTEIGQLIGPPTCLLGEE